MVASDHKINLAANLFFDIQKKDIPTMISSLFLLLTVPMANAYINMGVSCADFVVEGGAVEEVCAYHEEQGPSIATMEDGEVEYIGDYVDTFNILQLSDNMTQADFDTMTTNYTSFMTGLVVEVTRFTTQEGCQVTVDGTMCEECVVCGANSTDISVDCTTVPEGRMVECESVDAVFFPFEGYMPLAAMADNATVAPAGTLAPDDTIEDADADSASNQPMAVYFVSALVALAAIVQL